MSNFIKILVVIFLVFVWSGPAAGIDKSKKTKSKKDKTVQVRKKNSAKPKDAKKYDNFVDGNNNGIDDRSEKRPAKKEKKKSPPTKVTRKSTKP